MARITSLSQLKDLWPRIHDLDKAHAIKAIRDSGTSVRQIASQLNRSESSLRHLLVALDAPSIDQALARQGKISTNELVRRSRAAAQVRADQREGLIAKENQRATLLAADQICEWIVEHRIPGSYGEQIVEDVRREFDGMAQTGNHPAQRFPHNTPVSEIIDLTKPPIPANDGIEVINAFEEWLLRWVYHAFPNVDVRDNALDIALERQGKR